MDKTIVILAIDALEYDKVVEYGCKNLQQKFYGKTNITEFTQPRTMVLWSSFMTGMNKEDEVIKDGNKEMWSKTWDISETLFRLFKSPVVIDLPGYSYDLETHKKSRELLQLFFNSNQENQAKVRTDYNTDTITHHKTIKQQFIDALKNDTNDFILGYFGVIDIIGHLNFGNRLLMKTLYHEMNELCENISKYRPNSSILVMSDHGMKAVGPFGDHSDYGFWSTNWTDMGTPTLAEIHNAIVKLHGERK